MIILLKTQIPVAIIKSNSMDPYLRKGDLVIVKGIKDDSSIREGSIADRNGDVIVFNASGLWEKAPKEPIVHRVVEKWKNGSIWYFRTKGDANPKVDPSAIPEDRILGIVKRVIPYVGWGKIVLMQISFIIQIAIFSCLMSYLIIKFRRIKFD
jgi:signal peptidase I